MCSTVVRLGAAVGGWLGLAKAATTAMPTGNRGRGVLVAHCSVLGLALDWVALGVELASLSTLPGTRMGAKLDLALGGNSRRHYYETAKHAQQWATQ